MEHVIHKNSHKSDGSDKDWQTNCTVCSRDFESPQDLVNHYVVHTSRTSLPKVICSICGKLAAIGYLQKHMFQHVDEREYPCTCCEKRFRSNFHLRAHLKIHREHKTVNCDECGATFKRKVCLDVHKEKKHPVLDPKIQTLECYLCKQQYKSLSTLKTHIYWHMVPKNHLCTQCGERFRRIDALRKHLLRVDHNGADNRKFQCEVCDRKFVDITQYKNHQVVHTKERPYACTYENCGKTYSTSKSLREHYRIHTGERPYHCKFCPYECINSTYLKRHMLVHTGRHNRRT